MSRWDDQRIGEALGIGVTAAGTIGALAAIVHAHGRAGADKSYFDRCHTYYSGNVPGYETQPGREYLVLVQTQEVIEPVCEATSIWFDTSSEEARFVYDLCRSSGALPPLGALLATAHHRRAGSHYVGKKGPMRGFNLWGQLAGKGWRDSGRPFMARESAEFELRAGKKSVSGPFKKFFDTPEDSLSDFLGRLGANWPQARAVLKTKRPNPYEYTWYLQGEHATHGGNYAGSLTDPGGPWLMGTSIVAKMKAAAQVLEQGGYSGLVDYAESLPEVSYAEALALDEQFDRSGPYPLGGDLP